MTTIYGLHDRGGEHLLGDGDWVLVTIELRPDAWESADFSDLERRGLNVICRLNWGYHPHGALPHHSLYPDFAARCGAFVGQSRGCRRWIIANEPNLAMERPHGQVITPEMYIDAYSRCRVAIRSQSGHECDAVIPAPVGPWNMDTGDWLVYQATVWGNVECEALAVHTYGEHRRQWMDSMPTRRYDFWSYRDLLGLVPADKQRLPVYITEMNRNEPWHNDASDVTWIAAAYGDIHAWNHSGGQAVHCGILYRWLRHDQWHIDGKGTTQRGLAEARVAGWTAPEEGSMASIPIDGRLMTVEQLHQYAATLDLSNVRRVVMHHTYKPDLAAWQQHGGWSYWREALKRHYGGLGWSAGPHLFAGPDGIGLFYDLSNDGRGVGGGTLERGCRHIEIVGDYRQSMPSGTTLDNAVGAAAVLLNRAGLAMDALTHHTAVVGPGVTECPGAALMQAWTWFCEEVAEARIQYGGVDVADLAMARARWAQYPATGKECLKRGYVWLGIEWQEGNSVCTLVWDPARVQPRKLALEWGTWRVLEDVAI